MYPKGAFKVTVFEQLSRVGGLWPSSATDKGLINPSMSTNLSKYTVCFSDKTWPENEPSCPSPMFPKASDVGQYLQRYVDKYLNNPSVEIKTGCRVEEASIAEDDASKPIKWRVRVQKLRTDDKGPENASADSNSNVAETEEHFFDHVIISSGFFGKPIIPKAFTQQKGVSIPIIHSSEFSDLKELLKDNKGAPGKILVVGGSMSGAETSATIAAQISSEIHSPEKSDIEGIDQYTLHHVTSKPFWTVPLFLPLKAQVDNEKNDGKVSAVSDLPKYTC
jgi:cation diffusion facilitator CzcD-associated flavoprotein CzcO